MSLHIADIAPDFTVETQQGVLNFHRWAGNSWVFFFSHPADFTPVCTTEMGRTAQLAEQFAARNVKPPGLSTDTAAEHRKWIADVNDTQQTDLRFPIVADKEARCRAVEALVATGKGVIESCRDAGISESAYQRWKRVKRNKESQ